MKNVVITILVVLVVGLGGYLVYDKALNKNTDGEVDNAGQNSKAETLDFKQVKDLYDTLKFDDIQKALTDLSDPSMASLEKINHFTLTNEQIFRIVLSKVEREEKSIKSSEEETGIIKHYSYSEDSFRKVIKKIFGEERENKFSFESISSYVFGLVSFEYDTNNKTIEEYVHIGGYVSDGWEINTTVELKDAKKVGNSIYIYENVKQEKYKDEQLKDTIEKTLKYTYVIENGNYRFDGLEVVNQ